MAYEIRKEATVSFPKRKAKKEKDYLSWLHELPCLETGNHGVQAAHLSFARPSYGHYGRGKGTKAPDRWALPLCPESHAKQHSMNETDFWNDVVQCDPHFVALAIWGLWTEMGDDATPFATAIIMKIVNDRIPW